MRVPKQPNDERRSADRVGIPSEQPVYIETVLDGKEVGLLVENFSTGGALLICPEGSDSLRAGKRLPNCLLVLPQSLHTECTISSNTVTCSALTCRFAASSPRGPRGRGTNLSNGPSPSGRRWPAR